MSSSDSPVQPVRLRRPTLAFGPFTFDPDNHLLRRGADTIAAPPRVLGVLGLLLERAGDLVGRPELIDRVWKDAFVTDTSLAEAVSALRQVLADDAQAPTYIQTVHRRGYRFVAPVATYDPQPPRIEPPAVVEHAPRSALSPSIARDLIPWGVATLLGLLAIVAVYQLTHREQVAPAAGLFSIQLDPDQSFDGRGSAVALSPDGTRAAWAACGPDGCRIYLRSLDHLEAAILPGTEDGASPFYSPDGAWLGFFSRGKLKKIAMSGGAETTLADVAQPLGAAWTTDGRIIFGSSSTGGLWQVAENGGTPEPLTVPRQEDGEIRHAWPSLAPDGRTIFFSIASTLEEDGRTRLVAATLQGRAPLTSWTTLLTGVGMARPLADDVIVVARGTELQVVGFDSLRRALAGVPQTIASGVATVEGRAQFAVSAAGSLMYVQPDRVASAGSQLAWWPSEGGPAAPVPDVETAGVPALSSDARRITWAQPGDDARSDVRVGDLERGAVTRLTHDGLNTSPVWAPDGRHVYFARREDGLFRIASVDAGGGAASMLWSLPRHAFPGSVSADGRLLAFMVAGRETKRDIWVTATGWPSTPREISHSAFDEAAPALSPDGSLLAYQSDEGGRWDVYIQRLSDGQRAIVSTAGGERPFWTADGQTVIYRNGESLMRAAIRADNLSVGNPVAIADLRGAVALGVAPDGRVLLERRAGRSGRSAVLALHWDRKVRGLLGPAEGVMPR